MVNMIEIGLIVNSHGVKGDLKVIPLTDNPERFDLLKSVYVDDGKSAKKYDVSYVKYSKGTLILKLKGIDDRNCADALKNAYLKIDRKDAVKLPEDSFFIFDLIGCEVFDENGILLGTLKDVLQTGSNDVYVVEDSQNKQILIPALKSVVKSVSLDTKRIEVIIPEGLMD